MLHRETFFEEETIVFVEIVMNRVADDVPTCFHTKAQLILLKIIKAYLTSLFCDGSNSAFFST